MDVTTLDRCALLSSPKGWQVPVRAALLNNYSQPLIVIQAPVRVVRRGWTITLGGEVFTIETRQA